MINKVGPSLGCTMVCSKKVENRSACSLVGLEKFRGDDLGSDEDRFPKHIVSGGCRGNDFGEGGKSSV